MTRHENVARAIEFKGPGWLPHSFPKPWDSDLGGAGIVPSPENRPPQGVDEWGVVWRNTGITNIGEAKEHPLDSWDKWEELEVPDVTDPARWEIVPQQVEQSGDGFIPGFGLSIYARVHYLRGLQNAWTDIYLEPEKLGRLIDLLTDMNIEVIKRYAAQGVHAIFTCDDWGWQDRLMIDPEAWRKIWKPRYTRMYEAAHEAGMYTMLHSCGYIIDILEDLIEAGLDVIQMDQQENMGLENLGERFSGRLTFYCPVDIQKAMHRPVEEIRAYCRRMVDNLGTEEGGFIAGTYPSPESVGHKPEATEAACEEFLRISEERYGRSGPE